MAVNRDTFWPEDGSLPSLSQLVGPKSWLLPTRLGLGLAQMEWLRKEVREWPEDSGYLRLESYVQQMEVVNDPAERGVKLVQDFVGACQDEKLRQDLLVSVSENRKQIPVNFRKSDLCKLRSDVTS